MQKKKIKLYLVFVFVLFVFVLYFTLKDNFRDIINTLASVNVIYLVIGILCVFISKYLIGTIIYNLSKKEKSNVSFRKILKIEFIYPFFAGITPGSLGGESSEILYLKQSGLPYGRASNVVMQKYIIYQISLIIVNIIAVVLNLFTNIVPSNGLINTAIVANFIFNIALLSLLFMLTYNKKFNHFIMNHGLSFLHKIKIIKDIKKTQSKLDSYLDNFDDGVDKLKSDKRLFIKLIFASILSLIFLIGAAIPVAWSLNIDSISVLNLFILAAFVKMISLLIVTPGNSGASEYCFTITSPLSHNHIQPDVYHAPSYYTHYMTFPRILQRVFRVLYFLIQHIHYADRNHMYIHWHSDRLFL